MIKKIISTLLLSAGLALAGGKAPGPLMVQPPAEPSFRYSSAEAGWIHLWADEGADLDGGYISISQATCPYTFVYLNAAILDGDYNIGAGIGAHVALTSRLDGVVKVGSTYSEDTEDWSLDAAAGFRAHLTGSLDLEAFYQYSSEDLNDDNHSGEVSLLYAMCPHSQLVTCGIFSSHDTTLTVGVRWNY